MSQDELIQLIRMNPGIEQSRLTRMHSHQLKQLLKKRMVMRISVPAKHGTTFRLYPVEMDLS